jgi:hypothetical protein
MPKKPDQEAFFKYADAVEELFAAGKLTDEVFSVLIDKAWEAIRGHRCAGQRMGALFLLAPPGWIDSHLGDRANDHEMTEFIPFVRMLTQRLQGAKAMTVEIPEDNLERSAEEETV